MDDKLHKLNEETWANMRNNLPCQFILSRPVKKRGAAEVKLSATQERKNEGKVLDWRPEW